MREHDHLAWERFVISNAHIGVPRLKCQPETRPASRQKAITKIACKPIEVWIGHRLGNAEDRQFSPNRQAAGRINYIPLQNRIRHQDLKAVLAFAVNGKAGVLSAQTTVDVRWMNCNRKIDTDTVLFPGPAHVLVGDVDDARRAGVKPREWKFSEAVRVDGGRRTAGVVIQMERVQHPDDGLALS